MERYERIRELGRGTFGVASLLRDRGNERGGGDTPLAASCGGQTCYRPVQFRVVKEIELSGLSESSRAEAENEAALMFGLSHPHIVACYDAFVESGRLHIIMEYAESGDLSAFLSARRAAGARCTRTEAMRILAQCCSALRYIHSKYILHRDLKTQNIFISEGGSVKLGDFGIAKVLASTVALARTAVGTPFYLAPEVCDGLPYGSKADMWSLGVVFHEVLALELPFHAKSIAALVVKIVTCKPAPLPDDVGEDLQEIAAWLLRKAPVERPSAAELLGKPQLFAGLPLSSQASASSSQAALSAPSGGGAAARVQRIGLPARALGPRRACIADGAGTPCAGISAGTPGTRRNNSVGAESSPASCWAGFAAVFSKSMNALTPKNTACTSPSAQTPTVLTPCTRLLASLSSVGGSPANLAATALTPYERMLSSMSATGTPTASLTPKAVGLSRGSPERGKPRHPQTPPQRVSSARRQKVSWTGARGQEEAPTTSAQAQHAASTPTLPQQRAATGDQTQRFPAGRSPTESPQSDSLDGLLAMLQDGSPDVTRGHGGPTLREAQSAVLLGRLSPSPQKRSCQARPSLLGRDSREPALKSIGSATSPGVPRSWESPLLGSLSPPRVAWELPPPYGGDEEFVVSQGEATAKLAIADATAWPGSSEAGCDNGKATELEVTQAAPVPQLPALPSAASTLRPAGAEGEPAKCQVAAVGRCAATPLRNAPLVSARRPALKFPVLLAPMGRVRSDGSSGNGSASSSLGFAGRLLAASGRVPSSVDVVE
eukprot:TRINITY_DN29155_c0_g2_i1.p1 TRINITY_DN29155_c0_g2~~TRINITY_DN29155_c0_g2_i1.p1  ORF type:complete len:798 (-),score=127.89 TRINITY_DN29155_c0_g2_i1:107-2434(-)